MKLACLEKKITQNGNRYKTTGEGGNRLFDTVSIAPRMIEEEMYPQKIYLLLLKVKINNSYTADRPSE